MADPMLKPFQKYGTPLINELEMPSKKILQNLGNLQYLCGTWTNPVPMSGQSFNKDTFSYCVMPLPQADAEYGYILKNFSYFEEITFSPINGSVPNRGGNGTEVANTLFYEQRVYFANDPDQYGLVHAENGTWLYLTGRQQNQGPYGAGMNPVMPEMIPKPTYPIVKQMSVPHGNSILAQGTTLNTGTGAPTFPDSPVTPIGKNFMINAQPYNTEGIGNPSTKLTLNPNQALMNGLTSIMDGTYDKNNPGATKINSYIRFDISTTSEGSISNIVFEQKHARVVDYYATYWLLNVGSSGTYEYLLYNQTILLEITLTINAKKYKAIFSHITVNTLKKEMTS